MLYSLTGKVVYYDASCVAIDCNGIAFRCAASAHTLQTVAEIGRDVTLFTYLSVKEDGVELFGFSEKEELEFFKLLIKVKNVGPKAAISVLSQHTPSSLALCIASGDVKAISKAQGIGPKMAQLIIFELKDKIANTIPAHVGASDFRPSVQTAFGGNISEAVSALTALGFSGSEAAKALADEDPNEKLEQLIKRALKKLSKG